MTIRTLVAPALVLAAILAAPPLAAQQITSPYDFVERSQAARAFTSWFITNDGVLGLGPQSGVGFGVGYNLRATGPFNVDARVMYFPTERTVFDTDPSADSTAIDADPTAGLIAVGQGDLALLLVDAALRFDLTGPRTFYRLQPYALLGVGGVFAAGSDNTLEETAAIRRNLQFRMQNGFTGTVGGGVEWYATERLTLRLDARDVLWKLHVPEGFILEGRSVASEEWVQNAQLSVGASFRF